MIVLNKEKIKKKNLKIKEILQNYMTWLLNLPYLECPHCGSSSLIKHGTYKRHFCCIDNGKLLFGIITIQRVKCKKCVKTHALLPFFIVPYKICLLDVILSALNNEEVTISIPFDTVDKWKRQFNKFLPYLKTMLKMKKKKQIINKIKENIRGIYEEFYIAYQKILMMMKHGIFNMAPF